MYAFGLILYELVARRRPMVEDFVKLGRAKFYDAVTAGLCVSRRRAACTTRPRASFTLAARPSTRPRASFTLAARPSAVR